MAGAAGDHARPPCPAAAPHLATTVLAVHQDAEHRFSKLPAPHITLIENMGVAGDAHCGVTVKHRSRVRADPSQPNLRQVHLISASLFDHVAASGFAVRPGELGKTSRWPTPAAWTGRRSLSCRREPNCTSPAAPPCA